MDVVQLVFSLLFSLLQVDIGSDSCRVHAAVDRAVRDVTRLVPATRPERAPALPRAGTRTTPCAWRRGGLTR